ncbi:MAG: PilZ domain-containing protein [Acidobacteriaceae bacterium]
MQRFDYRSPRFPVDLPVRLTAENTTRLGRCRDISREGMRMELGQPLPPDACGTVSMTFQNQTLELNVRVAHAGATQDGMKFIYTSDSERNAVARLLASLTLPRDRRRPVLVS